MTTNSLRKPNQIRRQKILSLLQKEGRCSIAHLVERFDISVPTAHRDIDDLVSAGWAHKVHGEVEYRDSSSRPETGLGNNFKERLTTNQIAKKKIARQALGMLKEDDVIFLDSSTTSFYLAREITRSKLNRITLVTNSCSIAYEFPSFPPTMTTICIGGVYDLQLNAYLGGIALNTIENLRIHKLFFSCVGISGKGIFTFHEDHSKFLSGLIERCPKSILLVDQSKLDREALYTICQTKDPTTIICDKDISIPNRLTSSASIRAKRS